MSAGYSGASLWEVQNEVRLGGLEGLLGNRCGHYILHPPKTAAKNCGLGTLLNVKNTLDFYQSIFAPVWSMLFNCGSILPSNDDASTL